MIVYTLEPRACDRQKMPILANKIIFSDEAHFDLGGYVNKQNCYIQGTQNSHAIIPKGIIGPFFFENEQGEAVTAKGDRYRAMLNEFLFTKIEEEDIGQHLISTGRRNVPHTAEAIFDVLRPVFDDCIMSRNVDVVWPPWSCDLTPLWGAAKDKCYDDEPETIDALKINIREAVGEIQLHTIGNVLKIGQIVQATA